MQNLRGVLADDPLRAVQVLPGVATGDDLRSEFTVRGSSFSHMNMTVDGFTTPYLLHAVRAVEDATELGLGCDDQQRHPRRTWRCSTADTCSDRAIAPARRRVQCSRRRSAEGRRPRCRERHERVSRRGRTARAIPARILARVGAPELPRHAARSARRRSGGVRVLGRPGEVRLRRDAGAPRRAGDAGGAIASRRTGRRESTPTTSIIGLNASAVGIGTWRWTSAADVVTGGASRRGEPLPQRNPRQPSSSIAGGESQLGARIDARRQVVDVAGNRGRRATSTRSTNRVGVSGPIGSACFRSSTTIQETRTAPAPTQRRDGRIDVADACSRACASDHWTLTDQSTISPWVQAQWRPATVRRCAPRAGLYQQFPDFEQVIGAWGLPDSIANGPRTSTLGVEQRLGRFGADADRRCSIARNADVSGGLAPKPCS